jgi:hypothetical protein
MAMARFSLPLYALRMATPETVVQSPYHPFGYPMPYRPTRNYKRSVVLFFLKIYGDALMNFSAWRRISSQDGGFQDGGFQDGGCL